MKKSEKFIRAMGELDERLIAEYQAKKAARKRRRLLRFTALAASFVLVVTASVVAFPYLQSARLTPGGKTEPSTSVTPVKNPPVEAEPGDFVIKTVRAERQNGSLIPTDTTFLVECENGTVDRVREHLFISTAPEYTVEPTEDEQVFAVRLKSPLSGSKIVSLSYVNNGTIDYSWAFQTESRLTLDEVYPRDGAVGVATDSVFELEFSASVTCDLSEYVTFEPAVDGTWEVLGAIARFSPDGGFAADTVYQVSVRPGISADANTLAAGRSTTFSTFPEQTAYRCVADTITADGINTYRPGEQIILRYQDHTRDANAPIGRVALEQFASVDDMIACVTGDLPQTTALDDASFTVVDVYSSYRDIRLTEPLAEGYYRARVYAENGVPLFDWVIQVHSLNAYVGVTERDIVVWTANADGLAEGVTVRFAGKEQKTDGQGLTVFKDATDGSEHNGYVMIGDADVPLALAVKNYSHDTYPGAFIYTDKPKYKNTDTVKVWGCIPTALFYEQPTEPFYVVLGDGEQQVAVTPDKNGSFETEIKLTEHKDDEHSYLKLQYDGKKLASCYFTIENYELQNYDFTVEYDKNYVIAGQPFEFDVLVTHVSGIAVAGKKVRIKGGYDMTAVTGADGRAHFSLPTSTPQTLEAYSSTIKRKWIQVLNGDVEENTEDAQDHYFYTVHAMTYADIERTDDALILRGNAVNLDGVTEIRSEGVDTYNVVRGKAQIDAQITVTRNTYTRTVTGSKYDSYSKRTVTTYSDTVQTSEQIDDMTLTLTVGEFALSTAPYTVQEATDTEYQTITVTTVFTHENGVTETHSNTLKYNHFLFTDIPQGTGVYRAPFYHEEFDTSYYLYRYEFDLQDNRTYAVGDTVHLSLIRAQEETEVRDGGTVLRVLYKEGILDAALYSDRDDLSFECTEAMLPRVYASGAYYDGKNFYRLPCESVIPDSESRKIDVSVTSDRQTYAPGDQVTLLVETKKADGSPISAALNLSVVNEAIFTADDWNEKNILSDVFRATYQRYYAVSSYRDYELCNYAGGYGGGGGDDYVRRQFADTAHFGTVTTDQDGRAKVTFTLPDTVTTWRITAHAASGTLYYGSSVERLSAELDFFIQSSAPSGVKASDDLVVNATSVLTGGSDTVDYAFTLVQTDTTLTASVPTGGMASVNFGKLAAGEYTVRVSAACAGLTDAVEYPVQIVYGTQQMTVEQELSLTEQPTFTPSAYPVTVEFYRPEASRCRRYLSYLTGTVTPRLDTLLAGREAVRVGNALFGTDNPIPNLQLMQDYYDYSHGLLRPLPQAEGDPVLTALYARYTPGVFEYFSPGVGTLAGTELSRSQTIGLLVLRAAKAEPVLADLAAARATVQGDAYLETLIACAYAFAGDYASAQEVYHSVEDTSGREGYAALRALVATFIDRENAPALIDAALEDDSTELYLPFAVLSYLKNVSPALAGKETVTVKCGEYSKTVTLTGIAPARVQITEGDITQIAFESTNPDIRVMYRYLTDTIVQTGNGEIYASLEGDAVKYEQVTLVLDLRYLPVRCGQIRVALPSSLKYCGTSSLGKQQYVGVSAKSGYLNISVGEKADDIIRLPLVVTAEGNYTFEPVVFTANGETYRSEAFTFDAAVRG